MPADLFDQHRAILRAAEDLRAAVHRSPRIPLDELNRLRVRLGGLIMRHRSAEDEFIYAPLLKRGGIESLPGLKPVLDEIQAEKSRYSQNVRRWTPQAIEADWSGYVAALGPRVDVLGHLIRLEEEHVYRPVLRMAAAARA